MKHFKINLVIFFALALSSCKDDCSENCCTDCCENKNIEIANADSTVAFIIPNIFTPNGDGINDEFYIPHIGITAFEVTLTIGQIVVIINRDNPKWDGVINGVIASEGNYPLHYIIHTIDSMVYEGTGKVCLIADYRKAIPAGNCVNCQFAHDLDLTGFSAGFEDIFCN